MAMGIKCSLFGHAYGETTVERDREEEGSEVVITIREIETCRRCGETRVVSENKEVTTIETPDDVSVSETDESDSDVSAGPTTDTAVGAEIVDAEAGEPVSTAEPADEPDDPPAADPDGSDSDHEQAPPAAEDDGVILDDEDEPEREPGEWPDDEEPDASEHEYGPEVADGIERFSDDDADDRSADHGEESADEPTDDVVSDTDATESPVGSQGESEVWSKADPDLDAERPGGTVTVPEGEFHCQECGFTTPVESSSLRAGDFCPECHQETLVHESG